MQTHGKHSSRIHLGLVPVIGVLAILLFWAYWPALCEMARKWTHEPVYSHAYLVPIFSLYLLWSSGLTSNRSSFSPSWWGLPILIVGISGYLAGGYLYFDWLEGISLLPVLAGIALLLGGWVTFRRTALAIAFLGFMIPLPYRIETALSQPLQRVATTASTYALQTIGLPAIAEGNVIIINDARIGVVDACNGLGMLLLFFAMATGFALVVRRNLAERAIIVFSAIPIALIVNILRITLTGLLTETLGPRWTERVFHDLAGWLMMPVALGLLWIELQCLTRMFFEVHPDSVQLPFSYGGVSTDRAVRNSSSKDRNSSNSSTRQASPSSVDRQSNSARTSD